MGMTPLYFAILYQHQSVVTLLLAAGANATKTGPLDRTVICLMFQDTRKQPECHAYILQSPYI